jgi:hypothetical protein
MLYMSVSFAYLQYLKILLTLSFGQLFGFCRKGVKYFYNFRKQHISLKSPTNEIIPSDSFCDVGLLPQYDPHYVVGM